MLIPAPHFTPERAVPSSQSPPPAEAHGVAAAGCEQTEEALGGRSEGPGDAVEPPPLSRHGPLSRLREAPPAASSPRRLCVRTCLEKRKGL